MSRQGKESPVEGKVALALRCPLASPIPFLSFLSPRPSSASKVQVLYGGTDLFDYEVRRTFNNDMLLAFISSSCIAALVYILTSCSGTASQKAHKSQGPLPLQHEPTCSRMAG